MSFILSLCMYFLSFTPLWLTVLFIDIRSLLENGKDKYTEIISVNIIIIFTILSIIILLCEFCRTNNGYIEKYRIRDACESKTITAEFLLSYILPLFAFDFCKWDQVVEFLVFFMVLGYLCVRHNYFSVNIILEIMQYRMYECELINSDGIPIKKIVISKRTLMLEKGKEIETKLLNNDFLLDIKNR